jgi:DNA-binding response OmpR family regulator
VNGATPSEDADEITPSVLVVDDEREVADTYALRLRQEYDVETAYGGREALELVDEGVDVVLLDRRMPDRSGDEVLRTIRERELGCRVIIVTAVDPGFDIVEMPFDDYLCKPVSQEDMRTAIDHQLQVLAYDALSEYFELSSKRAVLDAQVTGPVDDDAEGYAAIEDRLDELELRLRGLLGEFDDVVRAFAGVDREA